LHYGEGGGSSGFVGGGFGGISKKDLDKYGIVVPPSMKDSGKYTDNYGGNISWGQSFGRSTDYIKQTGLGELHVHAPKGFVTGANLNGKPISNYEASIIDLLPGKIIKNTGRW